MSHEDLERPEDAAAEVVEAEHYPPAPSPSGRRLDFNQSRYVSQLPSPDDLERYKQLIPDAPARLLAAAEKEQLHRHEIEDRLVGLDEDAMPKYYRGQTHGQIVALTLGLGYEFLMGIAIYNGSHGGIVGAAFGVAAMIWAVRRDPGGQPDRTHERQDDELSDDERAE